MHFSNLALQHGKTELTVEEPKERKEKLLQGLAWSNIVASRSRNPQLDDDHAEKKTPQNLFTIMQGKLGDFQKFNCYHLAS